MTRTYLATERAAFASIARFAPIPDDVRRRADTFFQRLEALIGPGEPGGVASDGSAPVFERVPAVTGPMSVFGYNYFDDHYHGVAPRLRTYQGQRGAGDEYAYEILNLVDGKRTAREIRDVVSAEYGPVPLGLVVEYLRALEMAGVVRARK
jgi:hypothetical protein